MSKWPMVKLNKIASVFSGQGAPQGNDDFSNEGIPFIRAGHLSDLINGLPESQIPKVNYNNAKKYKLKAYSKGSILFAKSGMSCMKGYVYELNGDCYVVNHLACICPTNVHSGYLKRFFEYNKPNKLVKDESYPSISLADISDLMIPLPPLDEQKRIAAVLDKVQALIDLRKKQIVDMDALAQSVFLDMFGDPVKNEKGWQQTKLEDIGYLSSGGTPPRNNNVHFKGHINWYTAGELNTMYLGPSIEKITQQAIQETSAKLFIKGSLLIGMYDTAAFKLGILAEDSSSNQACANIKIDDKKTNVIWLYYILQIMRPYFLSNRRGIRQKNLNLGMIKGFYIPLPSINKQIIFSDIVISLEYQKQKLLQGLALLEQNYNALMLQYFS